VLGESTTTTTQTNISNLSVTNNSSINIQSSIGVNLSSISNSASRTNARKALLNLITTQNNVESFRVPTSQLAFTSTKIPTINNQLAETIVVKKNLNTLKKQAEKEGISISELIKMLKSE
jgi:hypothetical protein